MRFVQFVVKVSKFCNLRCKYCYEFEELGRKELISRDSLRKMYTHIRDYFVERDRVDGEKTEVIFIWHGGEPLLLKPSYYWDTFADQDEVFGKDLPITNIVQTNLTQLDDERIELLRDGFDSVGVSVDVFGGLRVNIGGRDSRDQVLRNMQRLREAGIDFGAITVLSGANIENVEEIFRFYEQTRVPFRLLPLFPAAWEGQIKPFELESGQVVTAFKKLVDLWLESSDMLAVTPIINHVRIVLRHLGGESPQYFNKREWTPTILVDTNGECYGLADPYQDPNWALGNLFNNSLGEILKGPAFDKSARAAEERMAANCMRCKYFGACDGYTIAEETANYQERTPENLPRCVLERELLEHIELRLREVGMVDPKGRVAVLSRQIRGMDMRPEPV